MLESVDVDCEKLTQIVMPYSYHNLKKFNVGNLNIKVPWEFWNELNDYYAKTQSSCIFVGELTDRNLSYKVYDGKSNSDYIITDKYFVYVIPNLSLGYRRTGNNYGFFGANNISDTLCNNLKSIIYAKIDIHQINHNDTLGIKNIFRNCSNLTYINTKGWNLDYSKCDYSKTQWTDYMFEGCNCTNIDLSCITLGYFTNGANYLGSSSNTFIGITSNVEYIRYGSGWFRATLQNIKDTNICKEANLNTQHYIDLAEDIPDITGSGITNDITRTLKIGSNYNDYTKFPQTLRDKIIAKGWIIAQD